MKNLDYYLQHYNRDMSCAEVAKALGISASRCKTAACDFRRKGYDIPTKARPTGYVTEWHRKGGVAKRTKQPDGSWKYTPIGRKGKTKYKIGDTVMRKGKYEYVKTETGWEPVKKCPIQPKILQGSLSHQNADKVAVSKPQTAKRGIGKALYTDRNPDKVKVPELSGGHWVRLDPRTMVYRKQQNAA